MAQQSSPGSPRGRVVAICLVGLGALLLTLCLAILFVIVPAQKKTPLDIDTTTVTDTVPGATMMTKAVASNLPTEGNSNRPECKPEGDKKLPTRCFIDNDVPMYSQRYVTAVDPSDSKWISLQAAQTLIREDRAGTTGKDGLVDATMDRVTLDRKTSDPSPDPVSSLQLVSGGKGDDSAPAGFVRQGLQYKFPFDAEKGSYPYFDANTFTVNPISYVGDSTVGGIDVYQYTQQLGPIDMYKSIREHYAANSSGYDKTVQDVLASYRRQDSTAGEWNLPGDPARKVDMHRYYTNTRTLFVDPKTGQIVKGQEDILQYFAESQQDADGFWNDKTAVENERQDPHRTAIRFAAGWNADTVAETAAYTQDGIDKLTLGGRLLPAALGVLGVVALAAGIIVGRRAAAPGGAGGRGAVKGPRRPRRFGRGDGPTRHSGGRRKRS